MNLGIYGGSFNPIHYGHLNVARQAITDLQLDRLLVIPANVSPFKTNAPVREYVSPLPDRLETVRAVFADMEKVVVDDRELRRGGVSYAIDTVREIAARFAAESPKLYFVVGEDSLAGLERSGLLPEDGPTSVFLSQGGHVTQLAVRVSGDAIFVRISRLPFIRPLTFTRRELAMAQQPSEGN